MRAATAGAGADAIVDANLVPGETVCVIGLGPVGLCAVQAAKVCGAAHVFAVDRVPERLALAERFGARAIDLEKEDPREPVRAATAGAGAD
ncbi:zinc-binding dehydrogenase, partial [Streptococcus pneumoniae]|uniref:zinc-binding dehydrogenase n=1 Tax=Streptococcus pneumoniae TaxID=1313 RepID=UPI001CB773D5